MAATAVTQYQDRLEKLLRQPGAINDLMAVCRYLVLSDSTKN